MRILVTGGAGFLGGHLLPLLLEAGHEPVVVDDLSTGQRERVPPGVRLVVADITAPLDQLFTAVAPQVVIHLAAQVSVAASNRDPLRDLAVNGAGTANLMLAAARTGVKKVVAISSAAVYGAGSASGTPGTTPVTEESSVSARSPYGLSKLTAEAYVRLLGNQLGLPYTILRPANLYGPGQRSCGEGAVVPAFLEGFLGGAGPVIHGDGSQQRDFLHVTDLARAVVLALDRADGRTLNISSGTGTSILTLWRWLAALVDWESPPCFGPPREGDIAHSTLANEMARRHLRWEPQVPLEAGLQETCDWYRANLAKGEERHGDDQGVRNGPAPDSSIAATPHRR